MSLSSGSPSNSPLPLQTIAKMVEKTNSRRCNSSILERLQLQNDNSTIESNVREWTNHDSDGGMISKPISECVPKEGIQFELGSHSHETVSPNLEKGILPFSKKCPRS